MNRRHGVILLAALLMVPLIAVALTVIGAAMSAEAQRSIHQTTQAQLEQMLLAGTQAASQRLDSGALPDRTDVPLPSHIADDEGELVLHVTERADKAVTVRVTAKLHRQRWSQTLTMVRSNSKWIAASAALGDESRQSHESGSNR